MTCVINENDVQTIITKDFLNGKVMTGVVSKYQH